MHIRQRSERAKPGEWHKRYNRDSTAAWSSYCLVRGFDVDQSSPRPDCPRRSDPRTFTTSRRNARPNPESPFTWISDQLQTMWTWKLIEKTENVIPIADVESPDTSAATLGLIINILCDGVVSYQVMAYYVCRSSDFVRVLRGILCVHKTLQRYSVIFTSY